MKKSLLFLLMLISVTLLTGQSIDGSKPSSTNDSIPIDTLQVKKDGAIITFFQSKHEIKGVPQDSKLGYDFRFSNTGNEPLLISNVRTSCHCTIASYPKKPIFPGDSNQIALELDTQMLGHFTKVVAVYSNAIDQARVILQIKWRVVEKKANETEIPLDN